jgi:PAS domain S-box-containing protein
VLQFGLQKEFYGAELRTALLVLGSTLVLFIALLMTAGRLKRIDEERQRSNDARRRVESELTIALDAMGMTNLRRVVRDGAVVFSDASAASNSIYEPDRESVERNLQAQLHKGARHYEVQYRTLDAQGQTRWILEKGEIRYHDGLPSELAGVKLDITETVQQREALRESEDRFRRIAEAMPQIVYVTDAAGNIEYINQRWRQYTALPTATHAEFQQVMPEEDLVALEAHWKQAHVTGEAFAAEFRMRGADGITRWFLTRAVPVRDVDGQITRWCGTSTDIDAQKRASEELSLVTDHAEVLLAHCDVNTRYVFVNKAYTRRFNLPLKDVLGKTLPQVLGLKAYERIAPYVKQVLSGQPVDFEIDIPYETLGSRYMYCRYVPDIDEATNTVRGFVAAITDVTERRNLEEQLRESDRRKDEFLALLAHELRNPLAPIRYAAGLLKPGVPQEISSAARDVIERQVGHMARLLDDLLDVSRVTRDALELRSERIDLRSVVTETVNTLRPLFESVNHRLTVNLPAEPAPVVADRTRLAQVLSNILNNAAKYTDPGGQIEVQVGLENARYVLRVIDSGAGIAPEFLPKIFEMFVQGDRRLTRASGGLGVGLSLAKRVVEMHGGTLEAFSEGPGRGSTFTVALPAAPAQAPAELRAVSDNVLPIFQRRHQLLIVDDNLDAANSLAILTQLAGYVTHLAADGLAAIEMAELVRPEAIVMDLGMPRMSGFEAARWVRQQPWGKDTVLIAVTGWGQEDDRRRSREAGFDVHLTKPVDSAELLKHLQQATEQVAKAQST